MENIYFVAALWLELAVFSTVLASHLKVSMALMEICVTESQYSILVAVVIGSALIPTMIANAWFLPRHLLKIYPPVAEEEEIPETETTGSTAKYRPPYPHSNCL